MIINKIKEIIMAVVITINMCIKSKIITVIIKLRIKEEAIKVFIILY